MSDQNLSHTEPYASVSQNTTGEPSEVISWNVPDGVEIKLRAGRPLIFDAEKVGGGDLDPSTTMALCVLEPDRQAEIPVAVSEEIDMGAFNALSLSEQQSNDNAQRRIVRFDPEQVENGTVTVEDADEIKLLVNSPDSVDASTVHFEYAGAEITND